MFQPSPYEQLTLRERLRTDAGRRAVGLGLALVFEAILLWLLLGLGEKTALAPEEPPLLSTFDAGEVEEPPAPEEPEAEPEQAAQPIAQPRPADRPDLPLPVPAPAPPAIVLPRDSGPTFDISNLPPAPASPAPARPVGPPAPSGRNDTPRVGTRPNGQPVYAAQWYREPTDQELAGYRSTMHGPGWGLIECRTAPEFRVEDCEFIDEYPAGSNIGRAWLQASWQFRVLPPRKGNRYLVGEWVRIRLVLSERPAPAYE